eukprot:Skav224311  [mRNA]  locus=scaffold227:229145:232760:- [translate_table: standard]
MRSLQLSPVCLDWSRVTIKVSSANKSSPASLSSFRINCSNRSISALSAAICTTRLARSSARSGRSFFTTSATN